MAEKFGSTSLCAAAASLALHGAAAAQCDFRLTTYHAPSTVGEVYGMTVFDDGTGPALIVGGDFWSGLAGVSGIWSVAKWDDSGWTPMKGGYSYGHKFIVFEKQLYAAISGNVWRWTGGPWEIGAPAWEDVSSGLEYSVKDWVIFDDGNGPTIFAAANGKLHRLTGSTWIHVALFDGPVAALEVFDDGNGDGPVLYAGGGFTDVNGVAANGLARWSGAAGEWSALGDGISDGSVSDLIVHEFAGKSALVMSGDFTKAGGVQVEYLAAWDGQDWHALPNIPLGGLPGTEYLGTTKLAQFDGGDGGELQLFAVAVTEAIVSSDCVERLYRLDEDEWTHVFTAFDLPFSFIRALTVHDGALYIGGKFKNPIESKNLVRLTAKGIEWGPHHPEGLSGHINDMAEFDDGSGAGSMLYASGKFPMPHPGTCCVGPNSHLLQRWDGQSWTPLITVSNNSPDTLSPLAVYDDGTGAALYVGGKFTTLAGAPGTSGIAKWDGQSSSAVAGGISGDANAAVTALWVHDEGNGPALYAGGTFTTAGATAASNIARWDGVTWSSLGPGLNGTVLALTTFDDGNGAALYAGGYFTQAGRLIVNHIAKWDGESWSPVGGGLGSSATQRVKSLAVYDDGLGGGARLFAGGTFTIEGGSPVALLAQWDGRTWTSVGGAPIGVGPLYGSCGVNYLSVVDDGSGQALYSDGVFSSCRPARWNGLAWAALANGDRFHSGKLIEFKGALYSGGRSPALAHWGPAATPLGISAQAHDVSVDTQSEATLWVNVAHGGAVTFRWHRDGIPLTDSATISGAMTDRLVIHDAVGAHEGSYEVVVSNDCTTVISAPIGLDVLGTCAGDVSGDGWVGVDDLLAVINNWGSASGAEPADVNLDGTVNVEDLLAVISAWGPCT